MERWKTCVRALKTEVHALLLAYRDPRVPWQAKLVAALVVAYAVSPIDLIPDFVPVLGYVDDLLLLPLGIWIGVRLIPPPVLAECRLRAEREEPGQAVSWVAAGVVVLAWLVAVVAGAWAVLATQ